MSSVRDIAIAISAGVCLSLLVSLTVIPTAASRLLARDRASHGAGHALDVGKGRIARWGKIVVDHITHTSERLVRGQITNLELTVAIVLFCLGVFMLAPKSWSVLEQWPWQFPKYSLLAVAASTVVLPEPSPPRSTITRRCLRLLTTRVVVRRTHGIRLRGVRSLDD